MEKLIGNILFKGMKKAELEGVLKKVKYKVTRYGKGETVAFRGDEIKGLYIVLDGNLVTEMMKENGEIKRIEALGSKQIIASAFIFGKNNYFPVDLISEEETRVLYMDKENLLKLMSLDKRIMVNFLNEISNKAQFLSKKLWNTLNNKSIVEKLINYIMTNKRENIIEFKPSLKEVANYFEVARPSLSRVIGEFVTEGILEKGSKRSVYILKDMKKMKRKIEE